MSGVFRGIVDRLTGIISAITSNDGSIAVTNSGNGTVDLSVVSGGGGGGFTVTVKTADFSIAGSANANIYVVRKAVGAATSVTLPATPTTNQVVCVKDGKGDAAANNITVSGNGLNIDAGASYVIGSNYGSVMIEWDGTQWGVIA